MSTNARTTNDDASDLASGGDGAARTPTGRPKRAWVSQEIERLMAEQGGMVGYRQLSALGLSPRSITSLVDSRRLVKRTEHPPRAREKRRARGRAVESQITTSVYASHSGPLSDESLRWRAVLSGPTGARLGGVSSCVVLGLAKQTGVVMDVLNHGADWDPPKDVRRQRTTHLPAQDCAITNHLPHLTPARSLMDAAARVDAEYLDDMLDEAVVLGVFDELDCRRVIDERPLLGRAKRFEEAIARLDHRGEELRSVLEGRTRRLIATSSVLPPTVFNVVADGYGHRPDIHFLGTRAIVECDGRADGHVSRADRLADEQRERILKALGYVFLRVTWQQVTYEPERTLRRIEEFVRRNAVAPVPAR